MPKGRLRRHKTVKGKASGNVKKIVLLLTMVGLLATAFVVIRIHAQNPVQPLMAEVPFDLEGNNPVPMTLQWMQGGKLYYYFSWGIKQTAGYRLEFGGIEKEQLTIRAVAPTSDDIVAQVQTFPKLLLVLPKGHYTYRVVDQFGRVLTSAFQTKNKPYFFQVYLPVGEKWASRRVWRDLDTEGQDKTIAQIAAEALMNQPEMELYAQQGLKVLASSSQGKTWYLQLSKAYSQLGYKEKAAVTEALRRTVLGLKVKGMRKVEIVTDADRLPMVAK